MFTYIIVSTEYIKVSEIYILLQQSYSQYLPLFQVKSQISLSNSHSSSTVGYCLLLDH